MENGKIRPGAVRRSETPQPIDTKFETNNYVRETIPCAKFRANLFIKGFSANGWNITKIFLRPFLLTDLQVRPPGGFSRAMVRTTRSHARVKPFREPREFQICVHFGSPTHRSRDTGHALSTFWPWKTCLCMKFSSTNGP